jgi:hypothetical protein
MPLRLPRSSSRYTGAARVPTGRYALSFRFEPQRDPSLPEPRSTLQIETRTASVSESCPETSRVPWPRPPACPFHFSQSTRIGSKKPVFLRSQHRICRNTCLPPLDAEAPNPSNFRPAGCLRASYSGCELLRNAGRIRSQRSSWRSSCSTRPVTRPCGSRSTASRVRLLPLG